MSGLGLPEMLVVGILLLVFVGPQRLPHVMRQLGRWYGKLRRMADELRRALVLEADRMDEEERLKELRRRRQEAAEERARVEQEGSRPQPPPDAVVAPAGEAAEGEVDTSVPAPGFTQKEWDELPPHIREIVARRRGSR